MLRGASVGGWLLLGFDCDGAFWYKTRLFLRAGCADLRFPVKIYMGFIDDGAAGCRAVDGFRGTTMSRVCQVTGKRPLTGNNVSHAKNRTRRRFEPNLHTHRFWVEAERRFVKLRVSTKGMRVIDKKGIEQVLTEMRARGEKV